MDIAAFRRDLEREDRERDAAEKARKDREKKDNEALFAPLAKRFDERVAEAGARRLIHVYYPMHANAIVNTMLCDYAASQGFRFQASWNEDRMFVREEAIDYEVNRSVTREEVGTTTTKKGKPGS